MSTNTTQPNGQDLGTKAKNDFNHKHLAVSFISKKTEKIVTAIYMVTDFVSESEPLRSQLRTLGLALISGTRRISARSTEPHHALAGEVKSAIDETAVLLTLATTIGIISEMNGAILANELGNVREEIDRQYGAGNVLFATHPGYANIMLTSAMFDVSGEEKARPLFDKGQENHKGQITPHQVSPRIETAPKRTPEPVGKKNDIGIKIARRNDVLNVIKSKGRASIKDVVSLLKDISEKTVQRELLGLVKEGVLVKEGEKRWSTYRVAS